jgi:hypothetical protein
VQKRANARAGRNRRSRKIAKSENKEGLCGPREASSFFFSAGYHEMMTGGGRRRRREESRLMENWYD